MSIEIFEGKRAQDYDKNIRVLFPTYESFHQMLPSFIPAWVREVLVVGCGTGTEMEKILDANSDVTLTGIDPSPEMTVQAKARLARYGNRSSIFTDVVGNLPQKEFGFATLILVMHFLPKKDKMDLLRSINERIVSKGKFVIAEICGNKEEFQTNILLLKDWLLFNGKKQEVVDQLLNHIQKDIPFSSEKEVNDLLIGAGFTQPIKIFQNFIYHCWICEKQ